MIKQRHKKLAIQKCLNVNNIKKAKKLISENFLFDDYSQWQKDRQAEYDIQYPAYRDMTNDEMLLYDSDNFTEENPKPLEFQYPKVEIEYITYDEVTTETTLEDGSITQTTEKIEIRTPENYLTYNEWINETYLFAETVYYTDDELFEKGWSDEEIEHTPNPVKTEAIFKKVRPYTPLEITDEMVMAELVKTSGVTTVSMRQCRLALLNAGLLSTVQSAIDNGTDEALKIEWEYALDVRRDWTSLVALATSLGLTSDDLDNLFFQASLL